jgi:hypothetical protein
MKRKATEIVLMLFLASMLFTTWESALSVNSLVLERVTTWYWEDDTYIKSVASADIDRDGGVEIVTGGWCWGWGPRWWAQLTVWDGAMLGLEDAEAWYWVGSTYVDTMAAVDVDGDGETEIITGGHYNDGGRGVAQLAVWDGATLALEAVTTWHWGDPTGSTDIESVACGDVDGDGAMEIVTGGAFRDADRTHNNAQLAVWDGATLALEAVTTWYWVFNTRICSVAVGDVDSDGQVEIVTGGYCHDGTRYVAQLAVWDGATLALEAVTTWYWVFFTWVNAVDVADVDGDGGVEIVTGGYHYDGSREAAQLAVWNGATLSLENVVTWYWVGDTYIESVAVGDVNSDGSMEIVTGGYYHDGTRDRAQLAVWDGATLALEDVRTWYWVTDTEIWSVACADVDGDQAVEIVTGGWSWGEQSPSGLVKVAQLCVWGWV